MKKVFLIIYMGITTCFLYADSISGYNSLLNDLFNYNTIGYKSFASFGADSSFIQGPLIETKNSLTFALQGNGFIQISDDLKTYYTRCCFFSLDENGQFRMGNGMLFLPSFKIDVSKRYEIVFSINNKVIVKYEDGSRSEAIIELFIPASNSKIISYGNYYSFSKINRIETAKVLQGFIEQSVVNVPKTILQMKKRLYELLNSKQINQSEYDFKMQILTQMLTFVVTNPLIDMNDSRISFSLIEQKVFYEGYFLVDFMPLLHLEN